MNKAEADKKIQIWAKDTWHSLSLMAQTETGFPDDRVDFNKKNELSFSGCTSPTNIGIYLTNVVAARDLTLITQEEALKRVEKVIISLERMKRPMGLLPNKICTATANPVEIEPYSKKPLEQIVSSIDMGWLLLALEIIKIAFPQFAPQIEEMISEMDFCKLHDQTEGVFYGHISLDTGRPSPHRYILENSETRILPYLADLMGLSSRDCLAKLVKKPDNAPPETDNTLSVTKSCGGTMFEVAWALQFFRGELKSPKRHEEQLIYLGEQLRNGGVDCCLDPSLEESELAPEHRGTEDRPPRYPYNLFGVAALGLWPYLSKDVLNPQASLVALPFLPEEAFNNLLWLIREFPKVYKKGFGFMDAVHKTSRRVAFSLLYPNNGMGFNGMYNRKSNFGMHNYVEEVNPKLTDLLMEEG